MVILDSRSMLGSSSGNQYLNPDAYISPLPETDAKSSPLAMLAKTCSQIGADNPNVGLKLSSTSGGLNLSRSNGSSKENGKLSVSPSILGKLKDGSDGDRSRSSSAEIKVTDTVGGKSSTEPRILSSGSSSLSPASTSAASGLRRPSTASPAARRGSVSPPKSSSDSKTPKTSSSATATASSTSVNATSATETSPIIRSGLEVLGGHPREMPLGAYPPGFPAPPGLPAGEHARLAAAAAAAGFPGVLPPSLLASNPFLAAAAGLSPTSSSAPSSHTTATSSSTSTTSTSSSPCRDPLCRDPGCPTSIRNQQLLAAATGNLSSLGSYTSLMQREAALIQAQRAAVAAAAAASPPGSAGGALPYVCNWVSTGADYCGRRFANSEELLLHLKTHTNLSTSDPRALSSFLTSSLGPMHPSAGSPLAASARFHPYSRPPGAAAAAAAAAAGLHGAPHPPPPPPGALGLPPSYLNPYASLYPSLFSRPPLL